MTKKDLISRLQDLVSEHGHDWKAIARVLNEEKLPTLKEGQWNATNARVFYTRATENKAQPTLGKAAPHTQGLPKPPQEFPKWLDDSALRDLRDLLRWWRERKGEPAASPQQRPIFKGKRRNTGVHVNETILLRAMDRAKIDKVRTGGSLSLLVEWLLWRYLGEPEDVLEPAASDEQPGLHD